MIIEGNENEQSVDELLQSIEAPSGERPMSGDTESPAPAPEAAPPDWRTGFDWTLDVNGQKVPVDSAEKAKTWLQMGHNYSQRAADLNREKAEILRQRQEYEAKYKGYDRYAEVDAYARQNPQWWEQVQQSFETRGQPQIDPSLAPILNPLLERLQKTEGVLNQWQEQESQRKLQQQDTALEAEIESIRKSNPTIDLGAVDETGRTLEWRVLNHASENGINSFRAAYRDYLHDKLVEETKAQALAQHTQGQTQAAQKGLLGKTPAPTKGLKLAPSTRGRSYDDLTQEALRELGIA